MKWFNNRKGFGFLTSEDGSDVFVHTSAVPSDVAVLRTGDSVEFTTVQGLQGAQVAELRVVGRAPVEKPSGERTELDALIRSVIVQLEEIFASIHQRGAPGRTVSFNAARSLRNLANRLNPPPA
ncbi:cold-shock protein [Actinokineospora sp. HUAS TT18]|uniref:cold-shock protein n=1 Tax=Actinokineospora sp. HUAS TT18 TaxID=3447451 RepID=UPI003F523C26